MSEALVVALLGAESTGKTTLADQLAESLRTSDRKVAVVPEVLREFCDLRGRTPHRHEQRHIAEEQTRRIDAASQTHDIVISDTTALMIAVYSHHVFGDETLYAYALAAHAKVRLTLLTALDLPWMADPQRDGPHVRVPVDVLVRKALAAAQVPFSVVSGSGDQRLRKALACVNRALMPVDPDPADPGNAGGSRWQWVCERCGDAACERHWLARDRSPPGDSTPGR